MQITENGTTYVFRAAYWQGVEVVAIECTQGVENWAEWSAEANELPKTPDEAADLLSACGWQIVAAGDPFQWAD